MKYTCIALVAVFLFLFTTESIAQQRPQTAPMRVAVVDVQTIIQQLPEYQRASRDFENSVKVWRDSLEKMVTGLQTESEQLEGRRSMMQPAAYEEQRRNLALRARNVEEFRNDRQQAMAELQDRMLNPIREKVLKAIETVAKEEKVELVLNKTMDLSTVIYADSKLDLTFRVLDRMKRGN